MDLSYREKVIHEGAGPCQGEVMGHGESATRAGGRAETFQSIYARNIYATLVRNREPRIALAVKLDTTYHDRRLTRRLEEDSEFRVEFERQRREIAQIDAVVRQLDELREQAGMSKAELARAIGKEPSSIRRLFTADVNPELKTVAAIADALGARVEIVANGAARRKQPGAKRARFGTTARSGKRRHHSHA